MICKVEQLRITGQPNKDRRGGAGKNIYTIVLDSGETITGGAKYMLENHGISPKTLQHRARQNQKYMINGFRLVEVKCVGR